MGGGGAGGGGVEAPRVSRYLAGPMYTYMYMYSTQVVFIDRCKQPHLEYVF